MNIGCTYDEETHAYYRFGMRLPSVTGIITDMWPRSDGAPSDAIERARKRGTWVDAAFMEYLHNGTVVMPAGTPQEYADCLGMAIRWWDAERGYSRAECQVRLFGEHEAGTADVVADDVEIIDLKATWEISKTVVPQLGGYATLRQESGECPDRLGVLHVHRRLKQAKFVEIDFIEATRQWRVLRDCWRLTRAA